MAGHYMIPSHTNPDRAHHQVVPRNPEKFMATRVTTRDDEVEELTLSKAAQIEAGRKIAAELVRQRRARGISPKGTLFPGETAA